MIETITSPLSVEQTTETIELHFGAISFQREAGKIQLWEPRYNSLFDYGVTPENLRLDPGFQILAKEPTALWIRMTFEIEDEEVRFADAGKGLRCFSIEAPGVLGEAVPGIVKVDWDPSNPKRCVVTWQQSLADKAEREAHRDPSRRRDVTVLRIACAATGPEADPVRNKVEGGVYVAIINKPRDNAPQKLTAIAGKRGQEKRVEIIGIDEHTRPVYNIFKADVAVDPRLELEPAFRAIEGENLQVKIALRLDPVREFETTTPEGKEVVVLNHSPAVRSLQLRRTGAEDNATVCSLEWCQQTARDICKEGSPNATLCNCTQGSVASFFMRLKPLAGNDELAAVDIDPTVIQPPVCYDGVCIPINGRYSGART